MPALKSMNWQQMVDQWGGWSLFQELLRALKTISAKHRVSIPAVAVKYVLNQVKWQLRPYERVEISFVLEYRLKSGSQTIVFKYQFCAFTFLTIAFCLA